MFGLFLLCVAIYVFITKYYEKYAIPEDFERNQRIMYGALAILTLASVFVYSLFLGKLVYIAIKFPRSCKVSFRNSLAGLGMFVTRFSDIKTLEPSVQDRRKC
jgi:hypothetical protein